MSSATTAARSRLLDVDALRGFALLGILTVNVWAFASAYYGSGVSDPAYDSGVDRAARFAVSMFFETKFYLLFSFLFGYSFTLQMAAAERAGAAFRPRIVRRQLGLLAIGIAHGTLLFHGDILSTYAVLGLVLLLLRGISPARAVKTAIWLIALSGVAWTLLGVAALAEGGTTDVAAAHAQATHTTAAFRGSVASVTSEHVALLPQTLAFVLLFQAPSAMAMFLLGLAAGRRRLFVDIEALRPRLQRMLRVGLPIGLGGSAVYAYIAVFRPGSGAEIIGLGIDLLTAPLLAAAYVAGALLVFRSRGGRRLATVLAPAGRSALSNYLLQSLVSGVVFTAYGFGLIGRLAPIAVLGLVPVVFSAQLALSAWWLRAHAYGPVEWLLRAVTIASWPPWRKRPVAPTPAAASAGRAP